jgi:L-seryl-tRNA(Ser) seleniumtransferase
MLGMMVAVETYLDRDADAEWKEWERRAQTISAAATRNPAVKSEVYVPPIANHVPHVRLTWKLAELSVTAADLRKQLRDGEPSIEIVPGGSQPGAADQEVSIGVWQMQRGEADIVARRLREVLKG